jgi:hypothetical protein
MKSDFTKGVVVGVLIAIALLFFLGAGSGTVGRYQVEMFTSNLGVIIDTQTGITKGFTAAPGFSFDFNRGEGEEFRKKN